MSEFGVFELAGRRVVLTGAQSGKHLFGALVAAASAPRKPTAGFLNFRDVDVATASFLREGIVAFRDFARSTLPNLFPVVANCNPAVAEELAFFLRHRRDAIWACDIDGQHRLSAARILGELDEPHAGTLDLVARMGTASAPALAAADATVAPTAWNNRLSFLAGRGLLVEWREGKTKLFSTVLSSCVVELD